MSVLITLTKDYSHHPIFIAAQLDEHGRLCAGHVRRMIERMDNLKNVKVGQLIGLLKDGSHVVDICSGCVFADCNGLDYSIENVVYTELKELKDCEYFLLAGPERVHIIASDGSGCLFKKC